MNSTALLRDLGVMREAGMMAITPNEAHLRADVLLLVGPGLISAWPELSARLLARLPLLHETERRIFWLCPGRAETRLPTGDEKVVVIGRDPHDLPGALAVLRARIGGRPAGDCGVSTRAIEALAGQLRNARFGVAVWSAEDLGALTVEMLCGLVKDLNAATRFSGLPLPAGDNAQGVAQACGWMSGFPVRTSFGGPALEHDPWRFDADRLVESGEADCAVWVSAYRPAAPDWHRAIPIIALTGPDAVFRRTPRVQICVGIPGRDHDEIAYVPGIGALAAMAATARSDTMSVAQAIAAIAAAVPSREAQLC